MNEKTILSHTEVSVAAETWIAVALLHREHPERQDFTVREIVERAQAERITESLRPGVRVHAAAHLVANRPPAPSQYRMLYAPSRKTRRLFRKGDEFDPKRKGKTAPDPEAIPEKYRRLLDWYRGQYDAPKPDEWLRGVWELAGAGKEVFAGVNADEYVRQLREGWN